MSSIEGTSKVVKDLVDSALTGRLDEHQGNLHSVLSLILKHGIINVSEEQLPVLWQTRCLLALDAIVEKDPLLLNELDEEKLMPMYKWILRSLVPLLSKMDEVLVNTVKRTIITIIHSIAFKLRLFSYKKQIRQYLFTVLDSYSENLLKQTQEKLNHLRVTVNLFSILTDAEVRDQLLLDDSYDHKFETVSRTIEHLISGFSHATETPLLDQIRSRMVIATLYYCHGTEYILTRRLKLLLDHFNNLLRSPFINRFPSTQSSVAYSLLFSFDKCLDSGNSDVFFNVFQIANIISLIHILEISPVLKKALSFLSFQYDSATVEYDKSPFQHKALEVLKLEILRKSGNSAAGEDTLIHTLQYQPADHASTLQQWLDLVKAESSSLSEIDEYLIISSMGTVFCHLSGKFHVQSAICDSCCATTLSPSSVDIDRPLASDIDLAKKILSFIIPRLANVEGFVLTRCYLDTLLKLFTHYQPPKLTAQNEIFQFLQRCFHSDLKEILMASANVMSLLVLARHHIQENNFTVVLNFLESIDLSTIPMLVEPVIFIWGQLAVSSEGDRLRMVLFKMAHFLLSQNVYEATVSFNELKLIAQAKDTTTWKLFAPILADICINKAKEMDTRPDIFQRIAELLDVSVETILERTSSSTVPYLLTYYKKDLVSEIADISKVQKMDLVERNKHKVIATLIMTVPEVSSYKLRTILTGACPEIKKTQLGDFIPFTATFWELLTFYSPEAGNGDSVVKGLQLLLSISDPSTSKNDAIAKYLKPNILGVVQCFFDSIRGRKGRQQSPDKLKSVYAIEFLSTIAGPNIVSVLPQIHACLTYALDDSLEESALHCWRILVQNLKEADLVTITDQTIAIVIQHWDSFDRKCKLEAKRLVNALFDKSDSFRTRHIFSFYSVYGIDDLAEIFSKVMNASRRQKSLMLLRDIIRRCRSDNTPVVKQGLVDLSRFLKHNQKSFFSVYLEKDMYKGEIQVLLSSLLNILDKFKFDDGICTDTARCIGMIGLLDPAKFDLEPKKEQFIVPSDFEDHREKMSFILKLLNQHLVPAFWSSNSPHHQLFVAYGMQEFLKMCGLWGINIAEANSNGPDTLLWNQFSEISKSTLTPLLSSKYTISQGDYIEPQYPMFTTQKGHNAWLKAFTLDVLKRASFGEPAAIFNVSAGLVKDSHVSLSMFLLPYGVLHLVVSGNETDLEILKKEILHILSYDTSNVHPMAVETLKSAYESIFNLLDYLKKWVIARAQLLRKQKTSSEDQAIVRVKSLLGEVPDYLVAKRAFQSSSFERSLMSFEQSYRIDSRDAFSDNFATLKTLYANIGDHDALDGALKQFSDKSLSDRIAQLEYSDNWRMGQDCLKALGEIDSFGPKDSETRLLNSLFDHELYDNVLERLNLLVTDDEMKKELLDLGLEASLLSGRLEQVENWILKLESFGDLSDNKNLVHYHIGKALIHFKRNKLSDCKTSLDNVYLTLGSGLGVSKNLTSNKIKPVLTLLHSLSDIESILGEKYYEDLNTHLDKRLEHVGGEFKPSWLISVLRKTADVVSGTEEDLLDCNKTWLKLAKISRKHKRLDLSTTSIMHASGLSNADVDFEYAKLVWAQGDRPGALKFIDDLRTRTLNSKSLTQRQKATIQLKYTKWLDLSNNSNSKRIIDEYFTAMQLDKNWDKPYYYLARYYNKILHLKTSSNHDVNPRDLGGSMEKNIVIFYSKAIDFSAKYLFEALTKLLTVWLDFAEAIQQVPEGTKERMRVTLVAERQKNLLVIHDEMKKRASSFPRYYWYTVFSQLLSRILHSNSTTGQIMASIAHRVVDEYPAQALWSVLAQYKSTQEERAKMGKKLLDLFATSDGKNPDLPNSTILHQSKKLFNALMAVCKKSVPKRASRLSLREDFDFDFNIMPSQLVLPIQKNFEITLPSSVESLKSHTCFPNSSTVTISKFHERVDILHSMQKPRRLFLLGSNGINYSILCKPKDDLRKDAKLMEFTTMVDRLLKKDFESERRKLNITGYAVIPLNEDNGIIEWVKDTTTMRDILNENYANIGIKLDVMFVKKILEEDVDVPEKADNFKNQIMKRYPPVLFQWFISKFPNPATWYDARNNYTRSTAVMSIVGYMLGLGDRHGENLLFMSNGGILHVDFDCLFDKAKHLAVPEVVPFRMTRNMVDAMGITGVEGSFKKSCEVTLQLIRNNETILMNILESFLHDPIMDWTQKRSAKSSTPKAALNTIRKKIRGILDEDGLAIGIQGQADYLIQEATSVENLCQMYVGWMAFY